MSDLKAHEKNGAVPDHVTDPKDVEDVDVEGEEEDEEEDDEYGVEDDDEGDQYDDGEDEGPGEVNEKNGKEKKNSLTGLLLGNANEDQHEDEDEDSYDEEEESDDAYELEEPEEQMNGNKKRSIDDLGNDIEGTGSQESESKKAKVL